jgi:hypothetical protein
MKTEAEVLRHLLQEGPLWVQFVKKDGTPRVMQCTLAPALLPPPPVRPEGSPPRPAPPEDLLVVYDLDKQGWRSFYANSLVSFSFTKETV